MSRIEHWSLGGNSQLTKVSPIGAKAYDVGSCACSTQAVNVNGTTVSGGTVDPEQTLGKKRCGQKEDIFFQTGIGDGAEGFIIFFT